MQKWSLGKLSGRLFVIASAVLLAGMVISIIGAPCSAFGAWTSLACVVPAALACMLLLIMGVRERSTGHMIVFLAGVAGTGMAALVAFAWTMLLCRGT